MTIPEDPNFPRLPGHFQQATGIACGRCGFANTWHKDGTDYRQCGNCKQKFPYLPAGAARAAAIRAKQKHKKKKGRR